jgi:2-dehydro-3-deoxyphosphogluconate aldolase/(4S)-4-hydroxy-2-oxoglutarate aldolase
MTHRTLERILSGGIIPVVRAPSSELADRAVEALCKGGIDVIELTLTVPGAVSMIRTLTDRFGDSVVVGAGTVLDAETARACILAGASFIVSPIVDRPTIACCRTYGVVVMPGALTPTEIMDAVRAGADLVKVFPCGALGGASYVRSLRAPFPQVKLVPTGGVSLKTAGDFIRAGACAVGVGADLVDIGRITSGRGGEITENARAYVEAIRGAREREDMSQPMAT